MPIGTVLTTGYAGAKAVGFKPLETLKSLNPFSRKEPNAGSSSFVDAIDNYEKISTSQARAVVPEITRMIAEGASDSMIASKLLEISSYRDKNPSKMINSWKWAKVQQWIRKTRQLQRSQSEQYSARESVGSAGGANFIQKNGTVLTIGALGALFLIFNYKMKK